MAELWRNLVTRAPWETQLPYQKFCTRIIVRSVDDKSYPNCDDDISTSGISGWFKTNIWDINENGIEVYRMCRGFMDPQGRWWFPPTSAKPGEGIRELNIVWIGRIPYRNIIKYNPVGDQYQTDPHLWVRYAEDGEPYDRFSYGFIDGEAFVELSPEARVLAVSDFN